MGSTNQHGPYNISPREHCRRPKIRIQSQLIMTDMPSKNGGRATLVDLFGGFGPGGLTERVWATRQSPEWLRLGGNVLCSVSKKISPEQHWFFACRGNVESTKGITRFSITCIRVPCIRRSAHYRLYRGLRWLWWLWRAPSVQIRDTRGSLTL